MYKVHFVNKTGGKRVAPMGWQVIKADNEEQAKLKFYKMHKWSPTLTITLVENMV